MAELNSKNSKIAEVAQSSSTPKVAQTAAITVVVADKYKDINYWRSLNPGKVNREKDLYKDKTFEVLCDNDDKQKVESFLNDVDGKKSIPVTVVPLRHKYNLVKLKEFASSSKKPKQVILLGSGYSTYAVRKQNDDYKKVKYFEVDFPEVLKAKQDLYNANNINPNATYIGANYTNKNFFRTLQQNGVKFKKDTLIIWEGNSMYLDMQKVRGLLDKIFTKFQGKVSVCFDSFSPELIKGTTDSSTLGKFAARMKQGKYPFSLGFSPKDVSRLASTNHVSSEYLTLNDLAKTYGLGNTVPDGQHAGVSTLSRGSKLAQTVTASKASQVRKPSSSNNLPAKF